MKELLSKAINIASQAHLNQFDKGGNPYILHPLWVMDKVRHLGHKYMIVAVLHDTVEDTDITIDFLREQGFPEDILFALSLLDFRGVDYFDRIKQIAFCDLAKQIKLRDLEHNSKITRLKDLRKKDFDRMEKYLRAFTYLKN